MAALTADKRTADVFGTRDVVVADLPTVADGDTWTAGIEEGVAHATISFKDAAAVAADSVAVASISGDTITFQVAGTARDVTVVAYGESA